MDTGFLFSHASLSLEIVCERKLRVTPTGEHKSTPSSRRQVCFLHMGPCLESSRRASSCYSMFNSKESKIENRKQHFYKSKGKL